MCDRGRDLYKGKAPPNVCRHLLISDIKKATADLPRVGLHDLLHCTCKKTPCHMSYKTQDDWL